MPIFELGLLGMADKGSPWVKTRAWRRSPNLGSRVSDAGT
jgi:hypothetical protein